MLTSKCDETAINFTSNINLDIKCMHLSTFRDVLLKKISLIFSDIILFKSLFFQLKKNEKKHLNLYDSTSTVPVKSLGVFKAKNGWGKVYSKFSKK